MTQQPQADEAVQLAGFTDGETGFELDFSGMPLSLRGIAALTCAEPGAEPSPLARAHAEMVRLEAGAIKNPDENRQVTHFTDRQHYTDAPLFHRVQAFAAELWRPDALSDGHDVEFVVVNGIGGSALGPQLLQQAMRGPYWNEWSRRQRRNKPRIYFLDNTDSAGIADLTPILDLARTVVVTISKSGGTQETLNNMQAFEALFSDAGLEPATHSVAVTMPGSRLHEHATDSRWLAIFPMAESIGGRTSETNIVGHLPAALTGIDFSRFVTGARTMDEWTRRPELANNPAYQLAVAWYVAGNGCGDRNMVILPYADRLVLLGRYLQQLVMESLGKERNLAGARVHQGLTVYGNKGGTDAHAYVQQLQDGRDDFFVTFVEILRDSRDLQLGGGMSMGDHLHAFKQGLQQALTAKGRLVMQLTLENLDEFGLGLIVALYERAVAVYAELIQVNAFHQPGVQAYKLASKGVNDTAARLRGWIADAGDAPWHGSAAAAAAAAGCPDQVREVAGLLARFAVNKRRFKECAMTRRWAGTQWIYSRVRAAAGPAA